MSRKRLPARERERLFRLHGGLCHLCGNPIDPVRERFQLDHVVPWALTRDDSDDNLRPAHERCHGSKTASFDVPAIAKADRVREKHYGMRPPSRFRHPTLKRKINGQVVAR